MKPPAHRTLSIVICALLASAVPAEAATDAERAQARAEKLLASAQQQIERQKYAKAVTPLERALEYGTAFGDAALRIRVLRSLATVQDQLGQSGPARETLAQAVALAREAQDNDALRQTLAELGRLQLLANDATGAVASYEEAARLHAAAGALVDVRRATANLGLAQ